MIFMVWSTFQLDVVKVILQDDCETPLALSQFPPVVARRASEASVVATVSVTFESGCVLNRALNDRVVFVPVSFVKARPSVHFAEVKTASPELLWQLTITEAVTVIEIDWLLEPMLLEAVTTYELASCWAVGEPEMAHVFASKLKPLGNEGEMVQRSIACLAAIVGTIGVSVMLCSKTMDSEGYVIA